MSINGTVDNFSVAGQSKKRGGYVAKEHPAMIANPWDGGMMTLREFFEREENEKYEDDKFNIADALPKGQELVFLNHIRKNGLAYQFLWYDTGSYSGQSLLYRRDRGKNRFKPIALDCHIPQEMLLILADVFEHEGVEGVQWELGV